MDSSFTFDQQFTYDRGYIYGQRYAKMHPQQKTVSPQMAGIYALAHLKGQALPLRHYFIRGFLEGCRRGTNPGV